jgi:hypothetical protein
VSSPVLQLVPCTVPEDGPARHGKPDEDAWNRFAGTALDLEERYLTLGRRARRAGYRSRHLAAGLAGTGGAMADEAAQRDAEHELALVDAARRFSASELQDRLDQIASVLEDSSTPRGGSAAYYELRQLEVEAEVYRAELEIRDALPTPETPGGSLILTSRKSTTRCREVKPALASCGCSARMIYVGCERTSCVRCAPRVTADRAKRSAQKLLDSLDLQRQAHAVKDARLYALRVSVFTMPPELRERFTTKKAWNRLRRSLWHVLRDHFRASWALIATHPVGDEDPTVFHPHLNVLWARRGIAKGLIDPRDLELLKRWWALLLERGGRLPRRPRGWPKDVPAPLPEGPAPWPVDVHGRFVPRHEENRIRHRARYYGRVFVGWGHWIPKALQWYGDFARGSLPVCYCRECESHFRIELGDHVPAKFRRLLANSQPATAPPAPETQDA